MESVLQDRTAVIQDRHPMWVQAFSQLLNRLGIEVVAHTTDRSEVVPLLEKHRPDVVVLELDASDTQGSLANVGDAVEVDGDTKVIVVSDRADMNLIETSFTRGASAYCTKSAAPDDFNAAIRQSFQRSIYLAGVSHAGAAAGSTALGREHHMELTRRELEILRLVAEGHSNSQLAKMLWVTEQTVKFHLSNIYRKLDVANRTEASRWAQLHGLLPATRPALAETAA